MGIAYGQVATSILVLGTVIVYDILSEATCTMSYLTTVGTGYSCTANCKLKTTVYDNKEVDVHYCRTVATKLPVRRDVVQ